MDPHRPPSPGVKGDSDYSDPIQSIGFTLASPADQSVRRPRRCLLVGTGTVEIPLNRPLAPFPGATSGLLWILNGRQTNVKYCFLFRILMPKASSMGNNNLFCSVKPDATTIYVH